MSDEQLRTEMRQDFLQFWISIAHKKPEATFHLYKNTNATGTLAGIDATHAFCNVNDLKTPIGTYPEATLRVNDLQQIVIDVSQAPRSDAE
ncbi:hypothetical protein HDU98_006219 [Podochytrium sp. JEL0797]|nr:hypothetical protein HDU98_006219 [Podochytrium sp. JEL0797]